MEDEAVKKRLTTYWMFPILDYIDSIQILPGSTFKLQQKWELEGIVLII